MHVQRIEWHSEHHQTYLLHCSFHWRSSSSSHHCSLITNQSIHFHQVSRHPKPSHHPTKMTTTHENTILDIPQGETILHETTIDQNTTHRSKLQSIILPPSLTEIQANAFQKCTSLQCIDIPKKVTQIGDFAFYDCHQLLSITLPPNLQEINNENGGM